MIGSPIAERARHHGPPVRGLLCARGRRRGHRGAGRHAGELMLPPRRRSPLRRLLRHAGEDGRGLAEPLVPYRRPGRPRARRLLQVRRPAEGRDPPARREHLLVRGRAGAAEPSRDRHRRRLSGALELAEDEVMAAIVRQPGSGARRGSIIRFCETRMPYFAVPRFLEFVDVLPGDRERQDPEVQAARTRHHQSDLGPRGRRHHGQAIEITAWQALSGMYWTG